MSFTLLAQSMTLIRTLKHPLEVPTSKLLHNHFLLILNLASVPSNGHSTFVLICNYRNSLAVAKENNIQYIAFPAISCGVFRYNDSSI